MKQAAAVCAALLVVSLAVSSGGGPFRVSAPLRGNPTIVVSTWPAGSWVNDAQLAEATMLYEQAETERLAREAAAAAEAEAARAAAAVAAVPRPPAPVPAPSGATWPHTDAWWQGVAMCEQGGRNDPYYGYFSFMDGSMGGLPWDVQVAAGNALLVRAGREVGPWAASCVAAGYAASPGG